MKREPLTYMLLPDLADLLGRTTGEIYGALYQARSRVGIRQQRSDRGLMLHVDDIFKFFCEDAERRLSGDERAVVDARRRLR